MGNQRRTSRLCLEGEGSRGVYRLTYAKQGAQAKLKGKQAAKAKLALRKASKYCKEVYIEVRHDDANIVIHTYALNAKSKKKEVIIIPAGQQPQLDEILAGVAGKEVKGCDRASSSQSHESRYPDRRRGIDHSSADDFAKAFRFPCKDGCATFHSPSSSHGPYRYDPPGRDGSGDAYR